MIDTHVRGANADAAERTPEPWPERVRASLAALLDVLSRDLAVARFYLVEPLAAGGEIAARYREAMQLLAEALRPQAGPAEADVEIRDQALMGGIATLITRRLRVGGREAFPSSCRTSPSSPLAPYLGRDEACRFARESRI